jgi:fructan beta-fructosidase
MHPHSSIRSRLDLLTRRTVWFLLVVGLEVPAVLAQQPDVIIADFEGANYGGWKTQGTAFGTQPAHGTLPGQMLVDGYSGTGLANSFLGGDDATGRLTSPPFIVKRNYIKFLIGGGGWEGKTCMNLLLNGRIVRTATGPNTQPGGTGATSTLIKSSRPTARMPD